MNTRKIPRELAIDLLERSDCRVQVAAVISDRKGCIISWGWNHASLGSAGKHAEAHAIERANRERLKSAIITVAARRKSNKRMLCARPCEIIKSENPAYLSPCMELLKKHGIAIAEYTSGSGWEKISI